MRFLKLIFGVMALALFGVFANAQTSLDEIFEDIQEQEKARKVINAEKLKLFQEDPDSREKLMEELLERQAELEKIYQVIKEQLEENAELIEQKRDELALKIGPDLYENLQRSKNFAAELSALLSVSITTAEDASRFEFLKNYSQSEDIPSMTELEKLGSVLIEEIRAQRQLKKFKAEVRVDGNIETRDVIRVGVHNIFDAQGHFLIYEREALDIGMPPLRLPKYQSGYQSVSAYKQGMIAAAKAKNGDVIIVPIDPTRGHLIRLLDKEPPSRISRFKFALCVIFSDGNICRLN